LRQGFLSHEEAFLIAALKRLWKLNEFKAIVDTAAA
jgi:hypothetical protein